VARGKRVTVKDGSLSGNSRSQRAMNPEIMEFTAKYFSSFEYPRAKLL
jgi:hypothetical protein